MMTEGVLRNAASEYYAIGFRDDGSTVMGKPSLRITAQSDYGRSLTVTAFNYVRQSSFGIYLYDSTFNACATTGTSEEGVDVVCSAVGGSLGLNGSLTLVVEQVSEGGKDTPVGAGQYVLSSNLKAASYVEQLRALENGYRIKVGVSECRPIGIDTPADLEAARHYLESLSRWKLIPRGQRRRRFAPFACRRCRKPRARRSPTVWNSP